MIKPETDEYWKLKDEIDKDTKERYSYANKKVSSNGKLKRVGYDFPYTDDTYKEVDVGYVYRAVSQEEYDNIMKTGYIKSNQSKNIGYEVEKGITCYNDTFPGWYLPKEGGYILKIKVKPENEFFYDSNDDYVKTKKAIPKDQIVKVYGEEKKQESFYQVYYRLYKNK